MKDMETTKNTANVDPNLLQEVRVILAKELGQSPETLTDKQIEEYTLLLQQELQSDMGVHVRFEQQVFRTPSGIALTSVKILPTGEKQVQHITYQELNQRANRFARTLRSYASTGSIIGINIEWSIEQVIAILGVLKAGSTYYLLEPDAPVKRMSKLLTQIPVSIVLTRRSGRLLFAQCNVPVLEFEQLDMEAIAQSDQDLPFEGVSQDLAYVTSTANRVIALNHQSVLKRIDRLQTSFGLTHNDGFFATLSLLSGAFVAEVLWPLLYGATVILLPTEPECLLQAIEHCQGTVFYGLSSTLARLVSLEHKKWMQSLRLILCSGEPPVQELAERVEELTDVAFYYLSYAVEVDREILVLRYQSPNVKNHRIVGKTLAGLPVYVLDKDERLAPVGIVGTIYITGDADNMDPQRNLPGEQSRGDEEVLVATEYLGRRLGDELVEIVGSTNRVVWISGKHGFLPEIEAIILQDQQVEDCTVLVHGSNDLDLELIAYIVPTRSSFSRERLREHLENVLPDFLRPRLFVLVNKIPLTEDGIPDEQALARVEIIEANFINDCEQQIHSLIGATQVAVLVQESQERHPLRHISDIVPQALVVSVPTEHMQPLASTEVPPLQEQDFPLALVRGASLHQNPDVPCTLAEALLRAARLFPEKGMRFISEEEGNLVLSYEDLFNEALRIMTGLQQRGLQPQDKVIFQLERNRDIVSAFWGCILGGFIPAILAVPPTYSEPNSMLDRLKNTWRILERPLIILSNSSGQEIDMFTQTVADEQLSLAMIEDLRASKPVTDFYRSQPDDIAFFSLTSGSTGIPKCIMLSHKNLLVRARAVNQLCNRSADDCIFNWLPFDHIGSISEYHIRCVVLGCHMVYAATHDILKQPLLWLDIIDKYRCTHSWAANFAYALLVEALPQRPQAGWDLSCIKSLLTAGEAVSAKVVEQFLVTFAPYGLKRSVMQPAFGMAELGSGITYFLPSEALPFKVHSIDKSSLSTTLKPCAPDHPNSVHFIDLGPVIPECSMRIVDEALSILPERTIGRLQVSGDMVFLGYYKNPEINREVFTPDGWFTTGDLGFIAEGQLVITGREKETIIINGANYYNYEIESVIEELDSVEPSFTLACAVKDASATTEHLAIFFVPTHTETHLLKATIKEIRKLVIRRIGIKPDYILPVTREEIPKTSIGKLQRTQMSKRFEQGAFQQLLKRIDILLENDNTVPEWFYRKCWQRKKSVTVDRLVESPSSLLIFLDDKGLGEALAEHFSAATVLRVQRGTSFERSGPRSFCLDPNNFSHYIQLLTCLAEERLYPDLIMHLWNYGTSADTLDTADALKRVLDKQVKQYLYLLHALAQTRDEEHTLRLVVGSSNTYAITELEHIDYEKALGPSILKSAVQELPWLQCQHIDLPQEHIATDLPCFVQELYALSRDLEVAYRNRERLVPRFEHIDLLQKGEQMLPFQHEGMYVLSGGLGGIGIEIARYLLSRYQARVLLLGRSVIPTRDTWNTELEQGSKQQKYIGALRELEQAGGKVQYESVDVCNTAAVRKVVEHVSQQWQKPLAGVIHLAGTYHERVLLEETPEDFCSLLYPKVVGAWGLYELIKAYPQSIFINFSSLSGFFAGSMVGAYSAANSITEAFTSSISHQDTIQSYCLSWSVWENVGMSSQFERKEILEAKGFQSISAQRGLISFLSAFQRGVRQLFIGINDEKQNIHHFLKQAPPSRHKITAYLTRPADRELAELPQSIIIHDRFQHPCVCTLNYVREIPLLPGGKPDYERLKGLDASVSANTNMYVAPRTQIEQQISRIWQEVLGVHRVGIYDNFFELGGDSIQLTQVVSKLRQIGLHIAVKQLFQHNTVATLAEVIGTGTTVVAEQGVVEGDIPLTSAEWTFFTKKLPNPHYFNQAYAFEPKQRLDPILVEKTVAYLLTHHDGLRLRFQPTREGWLQRSAAQEQTNCFSLITIAHLSTQEQVAAIERHVAEAHAGLNLRYGPLMRVILFDMGQGQQRLFFVLHHLVTDGVSWRIFLEDFGTIYWQFEHQEHPQLPPKTSSFRSWAQRLALYASSPEIRKELPYWLDQPWSHTAALPYDHSDASNKEKLAQVIRESLTVEETQILLQQATNIYEATVVELLLSALSEAFIAWIGNSALQIELTHHGRDPLFEDLDVSRTMGWFSIAFPLILDMTPAQTLYDRVARNKAVFRRVPNHGYSYGFLRYMCPDQAVKESMQRIPQPEILFSYLGQVDHVRAESANLRPTPEFRGSIHDPEGERLYKLVFNGRRVNGRLEIICIYGTALIGEAVVKKLVGTFLDALRAMIAECERRK